MLTQLASRIGFALLSLLALLIIVFAMVRLTGNPLDVILPDNISREQYERAEKQLGLDRPLPVQFAIYISDVARGDLGRSLRGGFSADGQAPDQTVANLIALRLPATAALALASLVIILVVGVPLGVYSAYWRGGVVDRLARAIASVGQSAPSFWVGLLLIVVFAIHFQLLPAGGRGELAIILPAITMAFRPIAELIRLLRSSMLEVLGSDYVTFLRAKGTPEASILWKHSLRNAGLTTLTFLGILIASLFNGSLLIETVFDWPGIGRLMIEAINYRDFPLAQGVCLVIGAMYIGMNLVVDVLYIALNPRLRVAGR
jgi:peptide/nickel transport system permease protein